MGKRSYLNFWMSEIELAELKALALAKGYSLSEFCRRVLRLAMPLARGNAIAPRDTGGTIQPPAERAA